MYYQYFNYDSHTYTHTQTQYIVLSWLSVVVPFSLNLRSDCFDCVYERSRYSNAAGHGPRTNLAPQNMQWAIRSREASRSASVRIAGGSNLVFIDPSTLRRSTTANTAVAASSEPVTMATTASCLSRAFGKLGFLFRF